nr:Fic family protein [Myxococcus sp. AB056]
MYRSAACFEYRPRRTRSEKEPQSVKERYQDIDEKNETLRGYLDIYKDKPDAREFLDKMEMSWIYHDAALEGVVYTHQELMAALFPHRTSAEASMIPVVLEIRNHKAVCDFIREEAAGAKKQAQITLTTIKRMHDLFLGNTPEAQTERARMERRERTEKELAKERDRSGLRKDMPLHRTYFHDISQPAKIQPELEKLVDYTASAEFREFHPIKQAATVQHKFVQIFPFTEHSGKVGRMCSNLILLRNGYMPAVIHSIDRQRYYESFRGPAAGFRTVLMDAMENSLDNGMKYFRDLGRKYKALNS